MIDFKEELKKFSPNMEIKEPQDGENLDNISGVGDMLELLQYLSSKIKPTETNTNASATAGKNAPSGANAGKEPAMTPGMQIISGMNDVSINANVNNANRNSRGIPKGRQ